MAGCRALTLDEIELVTNQLKTARDKCLFILGVRTGFRLSELLSLTIQDVYQNNTVVDRVRVFKRNMKGRTRSREVPLHEAAKAAIRALLQEAYNQSPEAPLFASRLGYKTAITRFTAHILLKQAYSKAGVTGFVASHSMRKSFARTMYSRLEKDLIATQHALGHKDIGSTIKYLPPEQDAIDLAILQG